MSTLLRYSDRAARAEEEARGQYTNTSSSTLGATLSPRWYSHAHTFVMLFLRLLSATQAVNKRNLTDFFKQVNSNTLKALTPSKPYTISNDWY